MKGSTTPLQGVTDDEITVSMLSVDLGMLADQGLAPDIGNPAKVAQAVVDDINAKGGVDGRNLVLKSHVLDANSALINPQLGQADCIAATEQDQPAAVIVSAALPSSLVRCVSVTHPVLSMTMNQWDDTLYKDGEGRIFSCCSGTSIRMNRVYKAWPELMVDAGALKKGDRVGIISQQPGGVSTDNRDAIENALLPSLKKVGAKVVGAAELPCPESSQTCAQHQSAIQKLKDAKAEVVFLTASNLAAATTVQAAKDLDYHPTWVTIGDNTTNTVANFFEPVKGGVGRRLRRGDVVHRRQRRLGGLQPHRRQGRRDVPEGLRRLLLHRAHVPAGEGPRRGARDHRRVDDPGQADRGAREGRSGSDDGRTGGHVRPREARRLQQRVPRPLLGGLRYVEADRRHGEGDRGAMTAPAIEAQGIDVAYGRVQVLFDVDVVVQEGETLALLGTNGAGKSTLLRAITGLVPTTGGVLRIAGQDAASLSTEQRVRLGLAHLLGGAATFGPLTTEENLQAATCRYRPDDARRRVASAFDLFPELDVCGRPARTLSGGQEQMLALAMALVHEPAILLIDELSLGLAPIVVERVLDVVRTMQAGGTSLVVVEQSLDIACPSPTGPSSSNGDGCASTGPLPS